MTWTYNVGSLATSPLYQARALIGDTLSDDPQLQDEEINFFLSRRASVYGGCALACQSLSSKFSRSADQAAGNARAKWSNLSSQYAQRAREFEARASMGMSPYAGAMSISDKQSQEQNPDRVPPDFNRGMDDNWLPVAPAGNESLTNTEAYGVADS